MRVSWIFALAACANGTSQDRDVDAAAVPNCDLSQQFGQPGLVPGIDSGSAESSAWLTPDELAIYVTSDRPGGPGGHDIFFATRSSTEASFGTPSVMVNVSTPANDMRASVTADGLTIFVFSDATTSHLMVATRSSPTTAFGAFTPALGATAASDADPDIDPTGTVLYFASTRGGSSDIYRAIRTSESGSFDVPAPVAELNTGGIESAPVISDDGLEVFFSSNRPNGVGETDIWSATRPDAASPFEPPKLVRHVNTVGDDWPVWLSPDRCRLYFASADQPEGFGGRDLWFAERPSTH
jgi:hypothetical protein